MSACCESPAAAAAVASVAIVAACLHTEVIAELYISISTNKETIPVNHELAREVDSTLILLYLIHVIHVMHVIVEFDSVTHNPFRFNSVYSSSLLSTRR